MFENLDNIKSNQQNFHYNSIESSDSNVIPENTTVQSQEDTSQLGENVLIGPMSLFTSENMKKLSSSDIQSVSLENEQNQASDIIESKIIQVDYFSTEMSIKLENGFVLYAPWYSGIVVEGTKVEIRFLDDKKFAFDLIECYADGTQSKYDTFYRMENDPSSRFYKAS